MKIALIGYGKMGHAIERQALQRGHEVTVRIDADNLSDFDSPAFREADVAIEFTMPKVAVDNYRRCLERGVKLVSGTTGWTSAMPEVAALVEKTGGTFMWASNYSIGVNIFAAVNRYLAALISRFPQYTPSMKEIHHIHKLDHPSGTAITLAEGIIDRDPAITGWTEEPATADSSTMLIEHEREGEVPGTHIINWSSDVDDITITHTAHSRDGFALGAVMAAEWAAGRKGMLSMDMFMRSMLADPRLLDIIQS